MNHRSIVACGSLILTLALLTVSVGAASSSFDWPTRWRVNGNGVSGILEFTVEDEGTLSGDLLGGPVKGFVSGRKLYIRRNAEGRVEVWEGLLSEPRAVGGPGAGGGPDLFIAGTLSVAEAGQTVIHPWYGIPEAGAASAADSPEASPALAAPAPPPAEEVVSPPTSASTGALSGTWTSVTGERAEITQEGKALTVVLADGSSRFGRMTGASSLVVGLRQGCCNGKLEGPDVIVWSDGARWQRVD